VSEGPANDPATEQIQSPRRNRATLAEDTESKDLILAGLYLGQRLGDIARLRWTHIDLEHAEVSDLLRKQAARRLFRLPRRDYDSSPKS
jgi:hypothetical protein